MMNTIFLLGYALDLVEHGLCFALVVRCRRVFLMVRCRRGFLVLLRLHRGLHKCSAQRVPMVLMDGHVES